MIGRPAFAALEFFPHRRFRRVAAGVRDFPPECLGPKAATQRLEVGLGGFVLCFIEFGETPDRLIVAIFLRRRAV